MATLANLVVKITGDTGQLSSSLDAAEKRANAFAGNTTRHLGGLKGAFGDVSKVAAGFLAANVVAGGARLVTSNIGSLISGASDLEESMSKVSVVFGQNAAEVQAWSASAARSFGQSKQQALEAAGTYGNLFQAFGVGRAESTKMSKSLVELAADLASFNNTSVDDALIALRSGLSGETEPLKRFGVAINDARLKEEALRMGLIKTTKEALTPGAKAQAAYALIMHDTALAQGDFARTSGGLANQQRILSASIKDLKAGLGTALLPVVTAFVKVLAAHAVPAVAKLSQHLTTFVQLIKASLNGEVAKAAALFNLLPKPLQSLALWLARNEDAIRGFVKGAAELTRQVGEGWLKIFRELGPELAKLGRYLMEHKPLLIALAIAFGVVVAVLIGIPALIAAIIVGVGLLAANWDKIKRKTLDVWNSIPGPIREALKTIVDVARVQLELLKNHIETAFNVIRDVIRIAAALWHGEWGEAWAAFKDLLRHAFDGIRTELGLQLDIIKAVIGEKATGFATAAIALGRKIPEGIIEGLKAFPALLGNVPDIIGAIFRKLWDMAPGWAKSLLGLLGMGPPGSGAAAASSNPLANPTPVVGTPTPTPTPPRGGTKPIAFHSGTPFVARDMAAFLQRGERVVSASDNRRGAFGAAGGGSSSNVATVTQVIHGDVPESERRRNLAELARMLREELGYSIASGVGVPVGAWTPI